MDYEWKNTLRELSPQEKENWLKQLELFKKNMIIKFLISQQPESSNERPTEVKE